MVKESSPVWNEIMLLETLIESGVLAPKRKWLNVVKRLDKHIGKLEAENEKLKQPHIPLDCFIPGLSEDSDPKKWGDGKVEGRGEPQEKLDE